MLRLLRPAAWSRGHVTAVLCAALLAWAAWPWMPGARERPPRTIVLYGFSILDEVLNEGVIPAFQERWSAATGERVEFVTSFGGSGTITNQAILGVPAQVMILSLELDALRLRREGVLTGPTWRSLPHGGVVNRTPFVILVRDGNPKGIRDFEDLGAEGIGVVHPDPLTSGGANWAILAEYGAGERERPGGGREVLRGVWSNVVAQAASARAARTQFEQGHGDALVTYEQEVLRDLAKGRLKGSIVHPPRTVLSEHVVVVIDRNVEPEDRELVDAFVAFLWSPEAQAEFARHGFRGVLGDEGNAGVEFPAIADPFLASDFGGWEAVKRDVVDATWRDGVLEEIRR